MRRSWALLSMEGIRRGREQLSQQFSAMEGWQAGQDPRFDDFVAKQRTREEFEAFDQRVERAFQRSAALHKAEVTNGFKRTLKRSGSKFTADTLREVNRAVENRIEWLREVWSQIDADYRSNDSQRQEAAANEISKALAGEATDFMSWVYERKRAKRVAGPLGRSTLEVDEQNLPEVADDEANRYLNLKMNAFEVERQVKLKYGIAGAQHWAELQQTKDLEYEEKLDRAAEKYKELLDQQLRYDSSSETMHKRQQLERTHEARVRFQAAMELEQEREKLIEAHQEMKEERKKLASERTKAALREAQELRAQGKQTPEVAAALKQRMLDEQVRSQDEYRLQEKRTIDTKKSNFLKLIQKMRRRVEVREGEAMLSDQDASRDSLTSNLSSAELKILQDAKNIAQVRKNSTEATARKQEIWEAINQDTWEDPSRTVHQARLDADRNYDAVYAKMGPTELTSPWYQRRQGIGNDVAGNEGDRFILQGGTEITEAYQWDNPHGIIHNLDRDGEKDYFLSDVFHVRDKKTGDIDWRYERKAGGPVWQGPRFYKIGEKREKRDSGNLMWDPSPAQRKSPTRSE